MIEVLRKIVETASAVQFLTHLQADDSGAERPDGTFQPSIVAPTTYPNSRGQDPGPNINAIARIEPGGRDSVELWTVLDSVPSQANRCEQALDDFVHEHEDLIFPVLDIQVKDGVLLRGLSAPHRSADAYFRATDKNRYVSEIAAMPSGQLRFEDDLTLALERFPTSLVYGSWAASTNAQARTARIYRSSIDGISRVSPEVYELKKNDAVIVWARANRRDPYLGGQNDLYPLSSEFDKKGWTLDRARRSRGTRSM